jgi:hypothetical protein
MYSDAVTAELAHNRAHVSTDADFKVSRASSTCIRNSGWGNVLVSDKDGEAACAAVPMLVTKCTSS